METGELVDKLWDLLPDYICGLVWTISVLVLFSFGVTAYTARNWAARIAQIAQPIHLPDLAVGFLIALFGVLLPYAAAVIFGPFSAAVANMIYRRWYFGKRAELGLTQEHFQIASDRIKKLFEIPTPESGGADLLYMYLRSVKSPLVSDLRRPTQWLNIQMMSVLPVSLLLSSVVYGVLGQTWLALLGAAIFAAIVFGGIVNLTVGAVRRWERAVVVAFLVSTASSASSTHAA